MCGIAGIYNRDDSPVDRELLAGMAERMNRRGPDGEGFYLNGCFGLAHKRLSIIDLATGGQPLFSEDSSIAAVVNGEIYNFHELREDLCKRGHVFKTGSDSECVIHLYEEYGLDFPKYMRGMFAAAILDSRLKKIILVTDRVGKKPVFYFMAPGVFAFASSIRALSAHPSMPKQIHRQAIWDYLSFLYIPAPDTIFQDVHKLRPGMILEMGPGMDYPVITNWWKPDFSRKDRRNYSDSVELLRYAVRDAVKSRLISDVPLGTFLSGGLDSTIITAVAAESASAEPLKCFSIGFDEAAYDETEQARLNAEFIRSRAKRKIEFLTKKVRPDDFNILRILCREYGEPFADSSIIPTYLLCDFARQEVKVALSGDGADELFGGYERYVASGMLSLLDPVPGWFRGPALKLAGSLLPSSGGERTASARLHRLLQAGAASGDRRYLSMISKCTDRLKHELAGPAFSDFIPQPPERFFVNIRRNSSVTNPVERVMEMDFFTYLPNDILVKADTASMAASLELRQPFLDTRVVELAASMPVSWKIRLFRRKRILADAFSGYYPAGLEKARKRGFGVPLAAWFRGPWYDRICAELLEGKAIGKYGLFRRDTVERLIEDHRNRTADNSYQLYMMLVLELSLPE